MTVSVVAFSGSGTCIVLGDVFPSTFGVDSTLENLSDDVDRYLCPFYCFVEDGKVLISNQEDVLYIQEKYKLLKSTFILQEFSEGKIAFKSPELYDTSLQRRVYSRKEHRIERSLISRRRVFIVLPSGNPVERGMLLDFVLESLNPFLIFLAGKRYGKNRDKTSTLMSRYLLKRGIERSKIVKIPLEDILTCLKAALIQIGFLTSESGSLEIYVLSSLNSIEEVTGSVKSLRRTGIFTQRRPLYYFTPFRIDP